MKIIRNLTAVILLMASSVLAAQDVLDDYLEMAAENNPELMYRFNEYMAALERIPQVKALPDPKLVFAFFISPVETRMGPQQFRISASQFFPWFGTLEAKENVAIESAKEKYELFMETKSSLYRDIKNVYYNIYFNSKSIEITRESISLLESMQKTVNVKAEAGMVPVTDEYLLELEINDMENQLAELRDSYIKLETEFIQLVNSDSIYAVNIPVVLWDTEPGPDRQSALDSVLAGNHSLLALEFKVAALDHQREVAELEGRPGFNISLDYIAVGRGETGLAGKDAFVFPSVGISIPLYRNKYRAMVKESAYMEAGSRYNTSNRINALEILFEKAWRDYADADRRIKLNISQSELAGKYLEILESEYSTAGNDFEELLRMERRLLKYSLELEKARADRHSAIAIIEYLMGK